MGDRIDYRDHRNQGICKNKEREEWETGIDMWVTGETAETMGTRGYAKEGKRGVGDWERLWVTGETTETMGTRGYAGRRERSGRLGESISYIFLIIN